MNDLIKVTQKDGKQLLSAKELYLGLGLSKSQWSRWYLTNIENNGYFEQDVDWTRVRHDVEGNETIDFAITLDFAKHIAMMARTEKSHEYRNYFIKCEQKLKEQTIHLTTEEILELQYKYTKEVKKEVKELKEDFYDFKDNAPLFNVECKELQALVRKVGTKVLGGYRSQAYIDNSLRGKVYSDIQHQLKREFGIERYEAIKRCQLSTAREIVSEYKVPTVLFNEISVANSQITM